MTRDEFHNGNFAVEFTMCPLGSDKIVRLTMKIPPSAAMMEHMHVVECFPTMGQAKRREAWRLDRGFETVAVEVFVRSDESDEIVSRQAS